MTEWILSLKALGYLGVFMASLIGAGSIIIPIPYHLILLATAPLLNPWLLTISASLGASLGELSGYLIGYAMGRALKRKYGKRLMSVEKLFEKFGPLIIFIFAVLPLPDDIIIIPLGLMRYSVIKTFIFCLLGKIVMSLFMVYTGIFVGEVVGDVTIFCISAAISLGLIIAFMLKVKWEKIVKR